MKKTITDKQAIARRQRNKWLLLWQGRQLKEFELFVLVRTNDNRDNRNAQR